jgi:hypothetical protein
MFTLPLILNALRVHCGYDNSRLFALLGFNPTLTLPLCTDAERTHDMHHRYNMCNYGGAYFICQCARHKEMSGRHTAGRGDAGGRGTAVAASAKDLPPPSDRDPLNSVLISSLLCAPAVLSC